MTKSAIPLNSFLYCDVRHGVPGGPDRGIGSGTAGPRWGQRGHHYLLLAPKQGQNRH